MAISVTHTFVSPVADDGDPNEVGPSEWNAAHTISGLGTAAEADSTDFATAAQGALADSAVQPAAIANMLETSDIGVSVQAHSAVLDATTASFLTAQETKLGHISVTQAVDLDAIETRVNALDAAVVLRGSWDASAGTFPGGGTAQAGDSYIVSVAGTVDSVAFVLNDRIIAIADNASTTTFAANWFKADYTDQVLSVAGKTGAVTLVAADISDITASATELNYTDGVTSAIQTQLDGKQASDADLTSWAGVPRASGFDTFVATPTSANLQALVTDETGTAGSLVFSASPTFTGTLTAATIAATGLSVSSASAFQPQVAVRNNANDANSAYFMVRKSRGVSDTAVQVSDTLGTFMFQGVDSTPTLKNAAYLTAIVESVSAGSVAARFELVASSSVWQFKTDNNMVMPGDLYRGANKVVGARATGWGAATGTATRTTFATGSVTTAQLAERVKALIDDLIAHGLIGA